MNSPSSGEAEAWRRTTYKYPSVPSRLREFQRRLLRWGKANLRPFPWRESRDPYKVLVAEIMLQRTQAEQVVPAYNAFVERFPDVASASTATSEELHSLMGSLGLNHRIDSFRKAIEYLRDQHGGCIPEDLDQLLAVPGVGRYTARAVLCFAFQKDLAVVDANVVRLLTRITGSISDKARPRTDPHVWKLLDRLLPRGNARLFNFAILDLAALVCKSRRPLCQRCFAKDICAYAAQNLPEATS